jgi:hypothetical protein
VIVFCFVFNLLNWYNNKKKEIGMRSGDSENWENSNNKTKTNILRKGFFSFERNRRLSVR